MKSSFLCLILALPILSFAQSNFHKGYILTNTTDTLKGYIDYQEHEINPSSVTFKTKIADKPQVFTPANCMGYGVEGAEQFQRATVNISLSKIEVSQLSIGQDSSSKTDAVFLKVLQAGKNVTLFYYKDQIKTRFYLKDKDDAVPYELTRMLFLESEGSIRMITRNVYISQMLSVMEKFNVNTEADQRRAEGLHYTQIDFLKLVSLINNQRIAKSKYARSRFFIGTGATASKAGYTRGVELANNAQSKNSIMPLLTVGADFFVNPAIRQLFFRFELSYFSNKSEVSKSTTDLFESYLQHKFNQKSLALTPQIIYNVYNADAFKIFIGAGVAFSYSSYSDNVYSYRDVYGQLQPFPKQVGFNKINASFPFTAGVVLNKQIEISAGYYFPYQISNNESSVVTMKRYKLGINYLFGKH